MRTRLPHWCGAAVALLVVLAAWHVATAPPDEDLALPTASDAEPVEPPRDAAPLAATAPAPAVPAREEAPAGAPPPDAAARPATDATERAVLRVHVVSAANGAPVAGVKVSLHQEGPDVPAVERFPDAPDGRPPRLDDSGWVEFAVHPGAALSLLTQGSEAWQRAARRVPALTPGERREVSFELTPVVAFRFVGRVVRASDGTPVAGAQVRELGATPAQISADPEVWKRAPAAAARPVLTTDADGCFEVEARSDERRGLRVDAPGLAPAFTAPVRGHPSRAEARRIELREGATLVARLLDEHGAQMPDVSVHVLVPSWRLAGSDVGGAMSHEDVEWRARTGADGRAVLENLPAGVRLEVEARWVDGSTRAPEAVTLVEGEVRELELRTGGAARVEGVLVDQHGAPLPGLRVWCLPSGVSGACAGSGEEDDRVAEATTDGAGAFLLEGLAAGTWRVAPAPGQGEVAPFATTVVVPDGAAVHPVRLVAPRALFLEGVVLGPDGEPVGSARVSGFTQQGCHLLGETAADGSFRLGPAVDTTYHLGVFARGGAAEGSALPEPVEARPGVPATLRLESCGGLRVVGRAAATGELRSVRVSCAPVGRDEQPFTRTLRRDSLIDRLRPGRYDLVALTADGLVGVARGVAVSLADEPDRLEIPLHPGGSLVVRRVAGGQGPFFLVSQDGLTFPPHQRESHGDTTYVLPPGTATVEVRGRGGEVLAHHRVSIAAGEETVVDLRTPEDPSR